MVDSITHQLMLTILFFIFYSYPHPELWVLILITEEIPSIDPLPSLLSAPPTILTLPFPFPIPNTQTTGPSTSHFSFPGASTTSSTLQPEHILQFQILLAFSQAMLAQPSLRVVSTVTTFAPH